MDWQESLTLADDVLNSKEHTGDIVVLTRDEFAALRNAADRVWTLGRDVDDLTTLAEHLLALYVEAIDADPDNRDEVVEEIAENVGVSDCVLDWGESTLKARLAGLFGDAFSALRVLYDGWVVDADTMDAIEENDGLELENGKLYLNGSLVEDGSVLVFPLGGGVVELKKGWEHELV